MRRNFELYLIYLQTGATDDMLHTSLRARTHWANFCLFCEKICHQFRETSAPGDFSIYQILSSLTKLQRRRRPASEQDKFLSGVKADRFVNLHAMIWRKTSIKKIWSCFLVRVFQAEARRKYLIFTRQSNGEDGRFVPRDAAWRSLLRIELLWFPSLHSSCISKSKYCSICTSLCKPTKFTSEFLGWSNWKQPRRGFKSWRERKNGKRSKETSGKVRLLWAGGGEIFGEQFPCDWHFVVNKYFAVFQCAQDWQI